MKDNEWKEFKKAFVDEQQEVFFYYKGEEWWISRLYGKEKSYLLTRSRDGYTQEFRTAEELMNDSDMDGKPFIERVPEFE